MAISPSPCIEEVTAFSYTARLVSILTVRDGELPQGESPAQPYCDGSNTIVAWRMARVRVILKCCDPLVDN